MHQAASYRMWGVREAREYPPLTHIQSNACWFLFLLFIYLRFAEAASFDKKELCRSDTTVLTKKNTAEFSVIFSYSVDSSLGRVPACNAGGPGSIPGRCSSVFGIWRKVMGRNLYMMSLPSTFTTFFSTGEV